MKFKLLMVLLLVMGVQVSWMPRLQAQDQAAVKVDTLALRQKIAEVASVKYGYRAELETWKDFADQTYLEMKRSKSLDATKLLAMWDEEDNTYALFVEKNPDLALRKLQQFVADGFAPSIALNGNMLLIGDSLKQDWDTLATMVWGMQNPELYQVIIKGDLPALKKMVAAGVDLKKYRFSADMTTKLYGVDGDMLTDANTALYDLNALHLATLRGHLEMVKYLQTQGFSLKSEYKLVYPFVKWHVITGSRALKLAITGRHLKLALYLIEQGMDLNHQDSSGYTPTFEAASIGLPFLRFAEAYGGNLKHVDGFNQNILTSLPDYESFLYVQQKYKLDVNRLNSVGEHVLFYEDDINVVKLLVKQGAKVDRVNNLGETPLHWAFNPEVIEFLVERGADLEAKSKKGQRPIDLAVDFGVEEAYLALAELMKDRGMEVPPFEEIQ